ncbi:HTTM domain-containing protein [Telmatocola sphagniphila]|uniref:HTTM domain-containing protein n=1 Tax=Telmatocola sphagniphila TaxID=1123043 RepID=A0A8E6B1Z6_9BACT|nr:HTTM domain-containing protein [Telmatocola sphagniphila]QVL30403.1 HTTM domain-containing protein [Telmatocola sphagniphila]
MSKSNNGVDYSLPNIWTRFFFSPTDPSTLGFMRVMIGLLVFYLHAAYFFNSQDLHGKYAWWDQYVANKQRRELPIALGTFNWGDDHEPRIKLPETTQRRAIAIEFLKALPDSVEQRKHDLRYLIPLIEQASDLDPTGASNQKVIEALDLAGAYTRLNKESEAKFLKKLSEEPLKTAELPIRIPLFLEESDVARREAIRVELTDFLMMVASRTDLQNLENAEWVFTWLKELSVGQRQKALAFMMGLPTDRTERESILDYMGFWQADPRQCYSKGRYIFSFWFHVTDPTTMWIVYGLHMVIIALFTLGFYTRITSVLTWIGLLNICHRTPFSLYGMDAMMSLLMFYMCIAPSGAAFSIDRLRARYRAARALQKANGKSVPWAEATLAGPVPSRLANCVLRMMQIHFSFMYLSAGFSKLKGTTWWNMTAPWYVMSNPEFCPTHFRWYEHLLEEISQSRPLLSFIFAFGVLGTLVAEIGLPFLVWTRLRGYAVISSVLLHLGIDFFMGLSVFSLFMHSWVLSFIPAALVREKVGVGPGGQKLRLKYNPQDPEQAHTAAVIKSLDLSNQVQQDPLSPNSSETIKLVDENGHDHNSQEIAPLLFRDLLLLQTIGWVSWIPGVKLLLRKVLRT